MKNLTTPQAILGGLALIALAIASIPYSPNIVPPAQAYTDRVQKVAICNLKPTPKSWYQLREEGYYCADVVKRAGRNGASDVHMLTTVDHHRWMEKKP